MFVRHLSQDGLRIACQDLQNVIIYYFSFMHTCIFLSNFKLFTLFVYFDDFFLLYGPIYLSGLI